MSDPKSPAPSQRPPDEPRDLVEFFARWSEFRPIADRLAARSVLSAEERRLIQWLIVLTDRISSRDIE
jgi:hypothetical protein